MRDLQEHEINTIAGGSAPAPFTIPIPPGIPPDINNPVFQQWLVSALAPINGALSDAAFAWADSVFGPAGFIHHDVFGNPAPRA